MPRITISYRRDDSLDITGRIFDRLAAHFDRESVFRDIDNIPPGADFRQHIDKVLDTADIILAIVGPRWMGPDPTQSRITNPADPVRFEIETALHKQKPLIPVLVSHAVMPSPEQLPESLRDFAYRNAVQVDSGQDFEHHIGRLTRAMEQILEGTPQPEAQRQVAAVAAGKGGQERQPSPAVQRERSQTSLSRLNKWIVLLASCVALSVLVVAESLSTQEIAAELSSLAALGKIAGLAGIALGVVVLLLHPVIQKLSPVPAKRREPLIRLVIIGAFGIGALGIVAWWSGSGGSQVVTSGPCGVAAGGTASGNTINCGTVPNTPPNKP
jgi:hypothetical protein